MDMNTLPNHLGGHAGTTHIDEGVLNYMKQKYNIQTMLDIGCGPGGMVKLSRDMGLESYGIDGDFVVDRRGTERWIIIHDYETGKSVFDKEVDLIWSCEFVEHIYDKYIPNFMKDFQNGKYVVMTYAPIGKGGHHHVNCNTEEYWISVFNDYGFTFNEKETTKIREVSTMGKKKKHQFIKQHVFFFENTK